MNKSINKFIYFMFALFLACIFSFFTFGIAYADTGYPGVNDGVSGYGKTATTQVGLKIDESQLCFTAPSVINFAMKGDGSFICPSDGAAKFTNNSIFALKVSSFDVASDSAATGLSTSAYGTSNSNCAYKIKVKPGSGTPIDFAVSGSSLDSSQWKISPTAGSNTLPLSFMDGCMKNIESNVWVSGHHLQDVVWTLGADI